MSAKRKILIVEDDPGLRQVHDIFFNYEGFDLSALTNGLDAITRIRENTYDIVVLDLGLPDIDGLDVLKQVREFSNVPIIVMTARTDIHSIKQCYALGANDYINKPFRPEILLRRIEAILKAPDARKSVDAVGSIQ